MFRIYLYKCTNFFLNYLVYYEIFSLLLHQKLINYEDRAGTD